MRGGVSSVLVAAAALCMAGVSEGSLIINEPFDYAIGTTNPDPDNGANSGNGIPATSGGTGLRGSWTTNTTVVNGLSYGTLATSGNALRHSGTAFADAAAVYRFITPDPFIGYRADPNTGAASANNGHPIGADGNTLYFSYLVNFADVTKTNRVSFSGNDGAENFFIGLNGTNGNITFSGPATTTAAGSVAAVNGVTNLIVGKLDFTAGGDSLSLWVNPDLGTFDGTQAANITATNTGQFSVWQIKFNGTTADNMTVDEFRLGTALTDVTPVPEPASLSVVAIAAAATLRRRRS